MFSASCLRSGWRLSPPHELAPYSSTFQYILVDCACRNLSTVPTGPISTSTGIFVWSPSVPTLSAMFHPNVSSAMCCRRSLRPTSVLSCKCCSYSSNITGWIGRRWKQRYALFAAVIRSNICRWFPLHSVRRECAYYVLTQKYLYHVIFNLLNLNSPTSNMSWVWISFIYEIKLIWSFLHLCVAHNYLLLFYV